MAKPAPSTWAKNHPLEGDGLLVNFYNHMWKKNKDFASCPLVRCPDTVVYDHNFPRGWYTYDQKAKDLKKKQGKELDTSSILTSFSRNHDPSVDIVASYLYSYETDTGESITSVEFFTKEDLEDFLNNRKSKKEGILQKFLVPKGLNNSLIQAVWSPRVCIVQRKTNRHAINDRAYSPYERAVTYEGPSHYTEDGICAPKTTTQIKNICENICSHFQGTEHKNITRMVLYFKVDKNDQVWLLWCGSIRISDRQHHSQMPLNLSPIFTSPDQTKVNKEQPQETESSLEDVDEHQFKLSGDKVFQMTHCGKKSPRFGSQKAAKSVAAPPSPTQETNLASDTEDSQYTSKKVDAFAVSQSQQDHGQDEWYRIDPHVYEQYTQLKEEHELVSQILDDVFYEAYSHFLQHNSGAFFFSLPAQLKQILGSETLDHLLDHLRIQPLPEHEIQRQAKKGPVNMELGLDFWIPNIHHQPISKLGAECRHWVKSLYAGREADLRKQIAISLGALGDDDVVNSYNIRKFNDGRPTDKKRAYIGDRESPVRNQRDDEDDNEEYED